MVEKIYKQFEKRRVETLNQPDFKEKEITPESEKAIIKEIVVEEIKKAQQVTNDQQNQTGQSVKKIKEEPKEKQVQLLIGLVFEKGLQHAIEVTKRLEDPYLLDEFHDSLVDELYNRLVQEGKIKKL